MNGNMVIDMKLYQYQQERVDLIKKVLPMFGDNFVLKGGTALSLYYNLDRFSEDIDLDSFSTNMNFLNRIKNPGYKTWNVYIKKDTDTVFRAMIDYGAKSDKGDYPLKIEVSSRNSKLLKDDLLSYKKIDGVNVYTIEELISMKIHAFSERSKARDVYDVGYLIKSYPDYFTNDQLKGILLNMNHKGLEDLEYMLKIEMEEHRLAKVDSTDYILGLYLGCEELLKNNLKTKSKGKLSYQEAKRNATSKLEWNRSTPQKAQDDLER